MWSLTTGGGAAGAVSPGFWRSVHWSFPARLALALAIFAAALLLRFALQPATAGLAFMTFYPSMVLCFALCGTGPGAVVTILSALTGYYIFNAPFWSFAYQDKMMIGTVFFLLSSIPVGAIMANQARSREALKELNATQRLMLENDLIGMAKIRDHRILWCNRKLEQILGCAPGELAGQSTRVAFSDDESWNRFRMESQAALRAGKPYRGITDLVGKNGAPRVFDISAWMMDAQTGDVLALLDDITARTELGLPPAGQSRVPGANERGRLGRRVASRPPVQQD